MNFELSPSVKKVLFFGIVGAVIYALYKKDAVEVADLLPNPDEESEDDLPPITLNEIENYSCVGDKSDDEDMQELEDDLEDDLEYDDEGEEDESDLD